MNERKEKGLNVSSACCFILQPLISSFTWGDIILFEFLPINFSWLYFNDVNTLCDLCYKEGRNHAIMGLS